MFKKKVPLNCANIQGVYATLLRRFTAVSIVFLTIGFLLYFFQIIPAFIDIEKVSGMIQQKLVDYKTQTGIPTGWGWLDLVKYADYISFAAIAFMAGVSIFVYLLLVYVFFKCRDYIFFSIAIIQILVFILAASGLIKAGH
jgi:hypothetical protein